MIHDRKTLGILIARDQHIGFHYEKYKKMDRSMPVAIVIGMDPVLPLAFLTPIPAERSEYDCAGGLGGQAIDLTTCETIDLEVPASAEIVIEGEVPPRERKMEGPFGEWMGHYGGKPGPRPVIHVQCVTHRDQPIFRGALEGKPITEDHICTSVALSALAHNFLTETMGIPGIRGVHFPAASGGWGMAILSMNQRYPGHSRTAAHALLGSKMGSFLKNVIITDEDINPYQLEEVWWAMVSRVQASRSLTVLRRGKGAFMDPSQLPELQGFTDTLIMEAVKPYEWQPRPEWGNDRFPPIAYPSKEVMEAIEKKWRDLGIPSKK
jgi:4-hydroxy-3-polyprenylbenzoate decarboxylase